MNKKIKYLLECLNKAHQNIAYRKEMMYNDYFEGMTTKYNLYNTATVKVHEGKDNEYEVPKITNMVRIKNEDMKNFTTLDNNYVSFTSEVNLLVFLTEYCDFKNVNF